MKEEFFEGEDFRNGEFKALIPKYYPPEYRQYIRKETQLLRQKLGGSRRVLEAGVGIGRLIPELAPIVNEFVGIDNADLMLSESKKIAKHYKNVKIVKGNLEDLGSIFPKKYFEYCCCLWNTLGNVKNELAVLKALSEVTEKSIFITVYLKETLEKRKKWYNAVGVEIEKVDEKREIFRSKSGLKSKSYSLRDIENIAGKAGLKIEESIILNGVMLWAELRRKV